MKSIFTWIALLLAFCSAQSQDIHFTLYDHMPLVFNPAETGAFYGTYRISAIYRDQWISVVGIPDEFKTPSLTVDLPIIKGFRDQDWVGVGGMLFSDKSGTLGMSNTAFKLSAAYHFGLNKKGTTILSLGYQTGSVGRRISTNGLAKIELESDDFQPGQFTNDPAITGDELNKSYLDHVAGVHFKAQMDQRNLFQLGFAVAQIGNPDASLLGGGGRFESPMRFIGNASWRVQTSAEFAIHPSAFVQVLGKASEIQVQAVGEYLLNPEKQMVLRAGVGYRIVDALQLIVGMDFKDNLKVTLAYDANISRLSPASGGIGGFELSAVYIGKIYKRPDPDPILFCPRF